MWGTRAPNRPPVPNRRFIPTHVGNTLILLLICHAIAVHPHACGEHHSRSGVGPRNFGSSPRMWGTLVFRGKWIDKERFIPTHVGNTKDDIERIGELPVHPHACGEHIGIAGISLWRVGSSPRMWGTPATTPGNISSIRFIPTHVGNTNRGVPIAGIISVHPHACGEHA